MIQRIKKIKPLSLAKVLAAVYALMGLIVGFIFSGVTSLISHFSPDDVESFGNIFGLGAIVVAPIMYGAMGFIGGLIMAWLYNFIASKMGGIEIELE